MLLFLRSRVVRDEFRDSARVISEKPPEKEPRLFHSRQREAREHEGDLRHEARAWPDSSPR
jgi:hypothetical protein